MIKREVTIKAIINRLTAGMLFGILCGITLFVTSRHFVNQEITLKWFGLITGVKQKMQELIDREDGINVPASENRMDVEPFNKTQPGQGNLLENETPKELLPPEGCPVEMLFSLCFEGKTGTDGNSRSKKLQDERRLQTPFFLAKQQK